MEGEKIQTHQIQKAKLEYFYEQKNNKMKSTVWNKLLTEHNIRADNKSSF